MKTIREVLNTIKSIKGVSTDAELAKIIDVPLDTMRGWIQNNSIRKQLLLYCFNNLISIDEVFFGELVFNEKRCAHCKNKLNCSMYQEKEKTPVTIADTPHKTYITINMKKNGQFVCEMYKDGLTVINCAVNGKKIDQVKISLQKK